MLPDHTPSQDDADRPDPERHQYALNALDQQVQHMMVAIEVELRSAGPGGLSELALIRALQSDRWGLLGAVDYAKPDQLYPVHFLVFNGLYRLRDQLGQHQETLVLSPLCLKIVPAERAGETTLPDCEDRLRAFYLDLSQYFLSSAAIHDMMDQFWAGEPVPGPEQHEAVQAARELGFDHMPNCFATVKQRFRKRVMRAHPDRGGNTAEVQALNDAFSVLKAHFAWLRSTSRSP
ncbi:MAG TPA: DNA-J related domain-containing protein [Marinobacter sp.]|nr:DNA-J related domain-containing protein [Marinobacter sp.]